MTIAVMATAFDRLLADFKLVDRDDPAVTMLGATRCAIMMLRDAKTLDWYDWTEHDIVYPNLGIY